MSHRDNIIRIKAISNALTDLQKQIVFVGGAAISLYTDREAEEVRPTEDVDIVVEIYTRIEYSQLEEKLRELGFGNDPNHKFVGRFLKDQLILDVMPLEEHILGFNNRWYQQGFKHAIPYKIDDQVTVLIFPATYFLAAKLEAFKNRGKTMSGEYDGRMSTDFEDIVYLLVYRNAIWNEMKESEPVLKQYLKDEFTYWLQHPYIEEWIDAHSTYASPISQFVVIPQLKRFIETS